MIQSVTLTSPNSIPHSPFPNTVWHVDLVFHNMPASNRKKFFQEDKNATFWVKKVLETEAQVHLNSHSGFSFAPTNFMKKKEQRKKGRKGGMEEKGGVEIKEETAWKSERDIGLPFRQLHWGMTKASSPFPTSPLFGEVRRWQSTYFWSSQHTRAVCTLSSGRLFCFSKSLAKLPSHFPDDKL